MVMRNTNVVTCKGIGHFNLSHIESHCMSIIIFGHYLDTNNKNNLSVHLEMSVISLSEVCFFIL